MSLTKNLPATPAPKNNFRQIRVLPLEPLFERDSVTPNLPLAHLDGIEQAAKALLNAVQIARGFSSLHPAALSGTAPAASVVEVCNEFLHAKAIAGRSDNYLRVSLAQLKAFSQDRQHRPLASVTAHEIETWLCSQEWSPTTRKNHLLTVRTFFAFAVSRSYLMGNPALAVDMPTLENNPPEIHTPAQVRHVLETARKSDLNLCRYLATRYFAGLRGSEAASLDESHIHPKRGFIEVTAAKSKTRRRRLVTIQPALAAWLALGGVLPLGDVNTKLWKLTRQIGFHWPRNVTRHSFVSYHLGEFQSASKTALEAGHTEQILFNHYRELVTKEDAKEFWSILPCQDSGRAIKVPHIES